MKPSIIVPIAVALIGGASLIGAEFVKGTQAQPPAEILAQSNARQTTRSAYEQPSPGSSSANSNGNGAKASGGSFDRACAAYAGPEGANSTCSKTGEDGAKGVSTYAGPKSASGNNVSN